MPNLPLSLEKALRSYAKMMNTGDVSHLEPLLADNFHYASQNVFSEMGSKAQFLEYITGKLATVRRSGATVFAEMGKWDAYGGGPCVIIAQREKENLVSVVTAKVEADKLVRLDICVVPPPTTAMRSGTYPGLHMRRVTGHGEACKGKNVAQDRLHMDCDPKIPRPPDEAPWPGYTSANWMEPRFTDTPTIGRLLRGRRRAVNSYLHGWRHWRAVAAVGCMLAVEMDDVDMGIVVLFSLLHDAERRDDGADPDHGMRAARLVEEVGYALGLTMQGTDLLAEACRFHNQGMVSEHPTIGTCWDADRLTLWRVDIEPSNRYLSTTAAKQLVFHELGKTLSYDPPIWSKAIAPFRSPLSDTE